MDKEKLFEDFKKLQEEQFELFKKKFEVYGDAYWKEDTTFMERYLGGIHRKSGRLMHFAKTETVTDVESVAESLMDIAVYANMELIICKDKP